MTKSNFVLLKMLKIYSVEPAPANRKDKVYRITDHGSDCVPVLFGLRHNFHCPDCIWK